MKKLLTHWKTALAEELTGGILPFWLELLGDGTHFPGRIDGCGRAHPEAGKSAILVARMLWAFSAAYRTTARPEYLAAAVKVRGFLCAHLIDRLHGGVFWEVSPSGHPVSCKKQSYALGFALYGLAEYVRATGDPTALDEAAALFEALETHAWDAARGGYAEALARDWQPLADVRLSSKDANSYFSMNTHLHLLEAYTNLMRVWPEERVAAAIRRLVRIHTDRIFNPSTGHLDLFFDQGWHPEGRKVSFGHDIEASWLVDEAVAVLGDPQLANTASRVVESLADSACEGLHPDGSLAYEFDPATGETDAERHWWVQAEAAVGFFNMYRRTGGEIFLERSYAAWEYIRARLLDTVHGEWFWSIRADGTPNRDDDKAGFWKCPYHNGRMCMELTARIAETLNPK